jgi:hypothetical protein
MPRYEFSISDGPPTRASWSVRSHAIRTALELRSTTTSGEAWLAASDNSKRTARCKNELKTRFRVSDASGKRSNGGPRNSPPTKGRRMAARASKGSVSADRAVSAPLIKSVQGQRRLGVEFLGGNLLDPFGTLPIQSNPRIDKLLKHCTWVCLGSPSLWLIIPSDGVVWFPYHNGSKK